jgi:hypothetical protein
MNSIDPTYAERILKLSAEQALEQQAPMVRSLRNAGQQTAALMIENLDEADFIHFYTKARREMHNRRLSMQRSEHK